LRFSVLHFWFGVRQERALHCRQQFIGAARFGITSGLQPGRSFQEIFWGSDQSLTGLVMQFKKAKVDKRIKAIILDVNMSGVGWGKAEEIRDAIADFRSSGKPVYAYMEFGLNKEYYIASACDKIYVPPPGELFINGLGLRMSCSSVVHWTSSAFIQTSTRSGKYKSAGDMFTQKR
jgi:protease-4